MYINESTLTYEGNKLQPIYIRNVFHRWKTFYFYDCVSQPFSDIYSYFHCTRNIGNLKFAYYQLNECGYMFKP